MSTQQYSVCHGSAFEVCAVNTAHTVNYGVSVFTKRINGAGTHTTELLQSFPWQIDQCVAFVDGNRDLQGHSYFGRPVLSPLRLEELAPDLILISAREAESEIATFLDTVGMGDRAVRLYGEVSGPSPETLGARQ